MLDTRKKTVRTREWGGLWEVWRAAVRDGALAVAAALVVFAGGGATWAAIEPQQQVSAAAATRVVSAVDHSTGVGASVSMQAVEWGSRLTLALHNAPPGSSCSLIAVGRDGERQVAASWTAKYMGDLTIPGAVAMSPGDITRFEVKTFDGHMLVSVPD